MGFFATFCGFCYNDYTSVPIYLFGDSCYTFTEGEPIADLKPDCVYPIGVDPAWFLSVQELTFMNSLKMKMAVIFGVAQMSLGIILKGTNTIQNRSMVDFIFELLKWLQDWEGRTAYAPSVISTMIDMFLNMGKPSTPTDAPIFDTWEKQTEIELTLLMVVAICVPAMLLVKPILLSLTASKTKHDSHVEVHADDDFKAVENLADKYDIKDNIIKSAGD
jgi:V-type H+-transporting ATPase subunit a